MTKPASKNQIKEWKKLQLGKYRKKTGLFLAEGLRCVEQILQNGLLEVTAVLTDGTDTIRQISIDTVPVFELPADEFASISDTETPQGVIAVCRMPDEPSLTDLLEGDGVLVALDAIQDPGNLGTIIRSAAWFGTKAIIAGTGCVDPYHPKVVRSSAGATGSVSLIKGDLDDLFSNFEHNGWQIYLMDGADDAIELKLIIPNRKSVLTIGNEANGISQSLFAEDRIKVRISGKTRAIESLNASIACGIALEHFSVKL
jgi:RNA methyltransferase, TrmH family